MKRAIPSSALRVRVQFTLGASFRANRICSNENAKRPCGRYGIRVCDSESMRFAADLGILVAAISPQLCWGHRPSNSPQE